MIFFPTKERENKYSKVTIMTYSVYYVAKFSSVSLVQLFPFIIFSSDTEFSSNLYDTWPPSGKEILEFHVLTKCAKSEGRRWKVVGIIEVDVRNRTDRGVCALLLIAASCVRIYITSTYIVGKMHVTSCIECSDCFCFLTSYCEFLSVTRLTR